MEVSALHSHRKGYLNITSARPQKLQYLNCLYPKS